MRFKLVEEYKPEFEPYTYAEVLERMNGNVSDEEIDKFLKFSRQIARLLKIKPEKLVIYRDEDELDHNRFVTPKNATIAGSEVVVYADAEVPEKVVCIREYVNGNYWYYLASESDFTDNFFEFDYEDADDDNYSPSMPWNAPGMKVSDFISEKLVQPKKKEAKQDYINRFMSDEISKEEFPDNKQRYAVCMSYWEKRKKNEDFDGFTKINQHQRKILNRICNKYNGWRLPKEIAPLWNELEEAGVEIGMITGTPDDVAEDGAESWTKTFTFNGQQVENSRLIYSVYKGNRNTLKNEYLIYFN